MQCKDISDLEFLEAVETARQILGPGPQFRASENIVRWVNRWDVLYVLSGYPEYVVEWWIRVDILEEFLLPSKLILAKARKLMRKGLLDGCDCGCRGDFVLTERGRDYVRLGSLPD